MDFPGASVSDPYGSALSVAPGTQFHRPVDWSFQAHEEGRENISLQARPFDGTRGCPVGDTLWKVLADGEFRFIVSWRRRHLRRPQHQPPGDGDDTVEGYVTGFDGGNGQDKALIYDCTLERIEPQVANVEDVAWIPCADPS